MYALGTSHLLDTTRNPFPLASFSELNPSISLVPWAHLRCDFSLNCYENGVVCPKVPLGVTAKDASIC